jgi:nuclear protein localization family protein 4
MSKEIVVRLSSSAGRSRVSIPPTASLGELQAKVQAATGVASSDQRLALDDKGAKPVGGAATSSLASLSIVNGTQIYLLGSGATMGGQVLTKVPVPVEPEKPVPAAASAGSSSTGAPAASSTGAAASTGGASGSQSGGGDGGTGGVDPSKWSDKADKKANFEVFDTFLRSRRYETSNLQGSHVHKSTQLKAGAGAIKIPPSVSIKQQPYRHVDQLSIYNDEEIQNFMSYWRFDLLPEAQQRHGWLFGYYLEDSNYGDKDYAEGTRAVVEGIYEPPQQMIDGDSILQDDPDMPIVKKITDALGLEMIGCIFTSFPLDGDQALTPAEVRRIARLQSEHSTDAHFTKYRLSKFVSSAVRPDPQQNGDPAVRTFMVSDQCSALIRDGMISEEQDKNALIVREAQKGECMPTFLVEGKGNRHIQTDFFVVPLVDSQPKKRISIFTHADFPRENRARKLQQRDDLKKYFKKRSSSEPSWSRFADFHLLLYIAKAMDVDTCLQLCECVRDRKEISEGTKMLFESLVG